MKKWLALLIAFILIPGCSFAATSDFFYDQHGNLCFLNDEGNLDVYPTPFPWTFDYNEKTLTLLSVDQYEAVIDNEYYPFYHFKFDVSQMSDDEIYRLNNGDMNIRVSNHKALDYLTVIATAIQMQDKLWTKDVKEMDIILGYESGSLKSYSPSRSFSVQLEIVYTNDSTTGGNTQHFNVQKARATTGMQIFFARDFSAMDSETYNLLKDALAEKGLKLE